MHSAVLFAWILMQAPAVAPPKQAPETPAVKPEDRCTISGVVTNARTGEPVRKASVTATRVMENRPSPGFAAMTDAAGRYTITALEPGKYFISASRTGFSGGTYGQKRRSAMSMGGGTQLTLEKAQVMKDINISMLPQGVVSGRITDEENEPIAHVQVALQRWVYMEGRRRLVPAGNAMSDDRGQYRVFGIAPGRYLLSATHRGQQHWGQAAVQQDEANAYYATTYYPGGLAPSDAATLEVAAGSDLQGIDLRLLKARSYRIAGRLSGTNNRQAWLMMFPRGEDASPWDRMSQAQAEKDGSFVFRGVRPGKYMIQANLWQGDGAQPQTTAALVELVGADVEGLQLSFGSAAEIAGTVQVDGGGDTGALTKENQLNIMLASDDGAYGPGGAATEMKEDGRFTLKPTMPDKYRVRVWGLPQGYYLKSVRFGREELENAILDMSSGVLNGEMTIVVSPNAAEVSGIVRNEDKPAAGATVVLVSTEGRQTNLLRPGNTDQNGTFTIKSVPPGSYKIYAFDFVEWGATDDPDFMKSYEARGADVVVKESERLSKDLKLIVTEDDQGSGTKR